MRTTRQLSITLPVEMAEKVRAKVQSGAYASESEVIREGLRILEERDQVVERWLREQVVPSVSAYLAEPGKAVPVGEAFKMARQRALARLAKP